MSGRRLNKQSNMIKNHFQICYTLNVIEMETDSHTMLKVYSSSNDSQKQLQCNLTYIFVNITLLPKQSYD